MKEHINSTIRRYLLDDATKTLVGSLVLSRIDYCNSLLAGLPQSLVDKLQRVQTVRPVLYSVHFHMFTSLQYSYIFNGCLSEPEFPRRLHASVSTPSLPPSLLVSLTCYICTLLLDLFAPVPTPSSSKFHSMSARQKVVVLSLTLVHLSGTHCHCKLEMLQLSTPSSLL